MTALRRLLFPLAVGATVALALTACASGAGSGGQVPDDAPSFALPAPNPPSGDVVVQGTVMDVGGDAELCLGAIAESYPPQCSGIPITNWSWEGVDGSENSGDVTWGAYAVQGTWDGAEFTVTEAPVMLALYDPMMTEDPTGGDAGAGTEAEIAAIQEELPDRLGDSYLMSHPENGRLWVDVVWDDGAWQDAADAEFGDDVVIVRSAMRALDG
ncbi:MAG: hypothetical protein ABWY55_07420 [Microbacterium sp.]